MFINHNFSYINKINVLQLKLKLGFTVTSHITQGIYEGEVWGKNFEPKKSSEVNVGQL